MPPSEMLSVDSNAFIFSKFLTRSKHFIVPINSRDKFVLIKLIMNSSVVFVWSKWQRGPSLEAADMTFV